MLFVALFLQLNWLQVVHAPALNANPLNGRAVVKEYTAKRGDIVSADGVTLATSVPTNDQFKYLRQYPTGALFQQITGYFSFIYGSDGAERSYDKVLTGSSSPFKLPTSLSQLRQLLANRNQSQSITLTVLDRLQKVAQTSLAGRVGSVVALDPRTGSILAMYSNPSFDPNLLSGHDLAQVQANYKQLTSQPGGGARARARTVSGTSPVRRSRSSRRRRSTTTPRRSQPRCTPPWPPSRSRRPPTCCTTSADETCGGQLLELFTVSCDTGFGQIGLDLGAGPLATEAESFGFNQVPPDRPALPGQSQRFPPPSAFANDLPGLAFSAIGQQNVEATPLEMAMVGGAIADGGTIMTPHILGHVTNSQNQIVSTYQAKPWLQATSAATAAQVTQLMLSVVNSPNGTGTVARIPGVQVAAKTGTAQTGTGQINAWFVAFAPAANPTIAVAVVLPDQPSANEYQGGTLAAPIAKDMIEAYLAGGGPG